MKRGFFNSDFKQETTISEIIELMFSKVMWIVVAGLIAAGASGVVTKAFITPMYKSFTTMYVYTNLQSNQTGVINNSDLVAAANLAETYKHILTSNKIVDAVLENIRTENPDASDFTEKKLSSMVRVSKIEGTQLIKVEVTSDSPQTSKMVADAYVSIAGQEITRVFKGGGVEIVDSPELPTQKSSPSLTKNLIIGFIIGAAAMAFLVLIRFMADSTIYTSEEIERISDLPIIGTIPTIEDNGSNAPTWNIAKERRVLNGNKEDN